MSGPKRRGGNPEPVEDPIEGLVVDPSAAGRTGEDTRRRGWFWHWNSIVTQYAPLLGLKGVGLLNSYTVWTDRREESPHRGYAFPSQQSEADFYGEDRAELITINKILVALDLIEIRKEMVLRTDPQGRRWRVPHNFYRVKDPGDDCSLTAREVMTIAQLADRDKAVYRYVRRIFSPRFSPIDSGNVWHAILTEVRQTDLWQRLAERTEQDERRASARTKAGHAARRAGPVATEPGGLLFVPNRGDEAATGATGNDSGNVITPEAEGASVGNINRGSMVDVEPANRGLDDNQSTIVAPVNQGEPTAVAPANTTYHQSLNTTTTTVPVDDETQVTTKRPARSQLSGGPGEAPSPGDAPGEATAIRAFAEANNRPVTPAERKLLADLAGRFSATAEQAPEGIPSTGWSWLTAAIYEAVEAGSTFVAPRRLREILLRWEREGYPQSNDGQVSRPNSSPRLGRSRRDWRPAPATDSPAATTVPDGGGGDSTSNDGSARATRRSRAAEADSGGEPASPPPGFVIAECGLWSEQVWSAVLTELERHPAVGSADFAAWLRSTLLLGRAGDGGPGSPLVIGVPHSLAQRRVASRFESVITATLATVVGTPLPVEIAVVRDWLAQRQTSPTTDVDGERQPAIGA